MEYTDLSLNSGQHLRKIRYLKLNVPVGSQFNPYLFENLGYSIRQAFGEAAANGFDAAVQGAKDLIENLANMAK